MPDLNSMGQRQRRQNEGQQHRRHLRGDHDVAAVDAIGGDPAQRRKQKHGNLAGESHRPQQQSRTGQPVDQPRLRHALHPRADQGN